MKCISTVPKQWLTDSRAYLVLLVCSVILLFPSVFTGFSADDYILRAIILQDHTVSKLPDSPLDAFLFVPNDAEGLQQQVEMGLLPWWTHPQLRIAFMRPLSALTHWFDFHCFPDAPWLMHIHNIVWYGILCLIILLFYRRFFGAYWFAPVSMAGRIQAAGIAALLYALDDARGLGVGWISNRNASIAAIWALGALLLHDRWRQHGWRPGAFLAPLCLALGLLGGESALAICGYLFAYALFIDRGRLLQRIFSLIPYAAITVLWRILYVAMGYGVTGTGMYCDPGQNPELFLTGLVQRMPVLLLGQLGMPNSGLFTLVPPVFAIVIFVFAVVFLSAVGWLLWPMLRRDPLSRFFTLGMLLAAVPSCSTYPNDRLLFFTGIGGMGLVTQYLMLARESLKGHKSPFPERPLWTAKPLFIILVTVHVILGPLMLPVTSLTSFFFERPIHCGAVSFPNAEKGQVIIVNLPIGMMQPYILLTRASQNRTIPVKARLLSAGVDAVEIEGIDSHTILVRPEKGLLSMPWDRVFRDTTLPFASGYSRKLEGLTIL
ncbi:MAG: hypothetical protein NTX06_00050, partial [Proteobacteria bacterium]|nr:hypothetical protein [Pseudomonadota bacterium]